MSKSLFQKPIEIKISTVVAVSAILTTADVSALDAALAKMTGGSADFFEDDLTVIDIAALPAGTTIDWKAIIAVLTRYRLKPVAVRNAPAAMAAEIAAHGLSLETASKPREEVAVVAPRAEPKPAPVAARASPTISSTAEPLPNGQQVMIIDTPVRAGQRVYAHGCDLIVTAAVNNGAELIADGSIHVYAPLRGRALAGASGDSDARIFAMSMEPELVSIAGYYRTFEDGLPKELAQAPGQVRLLGDRIEVIAMTAALHR